MVRLSDDGIVVGGHELPLHSGSVHYWRLDPAVWKRCLSEVKNLGLPMVEVYIPWAVHELSEGEFDFGQIDPRKDVGKFFDLAAEVGLQVFARPGPHINAELTHFGIPERVIYQKDCQAISPRGNPVILSFPPLMFPVPSYASRAYRNEVDRWYKAVAPILSARAYPSGPIVLSQVDNEAAFYFRNGPYCQDYHPDALTKWRGWLSDRYGSLASIESAHRKTYPTLDEIDAPRKFDATSSEELVAHLDWAHFQEDLLVSAVYEMRQSLADAGFGSVPVVHNVPLGDAGLPVSVPAMERAADLVGFDYYHTRREFRTIKRRTLYLAGTVKTPYAPELGIGAPPWFPPLAHEDSMFTLMVACAYGLRGFNLYMAVDRDRWYGAPIDSTGVPRVEAGAWKHFISKLHHLRFHTLRRQAEVSLVMPREYGRLSRATHTLGAFSPSMLEVVAGSPVDACRTTPLGFIGPIQVLWWRMLGRFADAFSKAGVPYVYVDGDANSSALANSRVIVAPSFEFVDKDRWKRMAGLSQDSHVIYGPAMPTLDEKMRPHLFEVPRGGRRVLIDNAEQAEELVEDLIGELQLARPFRAYPYPVETCVHESDAGPAVLFVINPSELAINATVELPAAGVFVDVLTGERFGGDTLAHIPMPALHCRMLEIERLAGGLKMRHAQGM